MVEIPVMCFYTFTSDSTFSDHLGRLTSAIKGIFTPKLANSRNQSPPHPHFPWRSNIHQHTRFGQTRVGWTENKPHIFWGVCVCGRAGSIAT